LFSAPKRIEGTQDIVVIRFSGEKGTFRREAYLTRYLLMRRSNNSSNLRKSKRQTGRVKKNLIPNEDLFMEKILDNLASTPIGQVLKKIASLPEVRRKKILDIRRRLTEGNYNLNGRLDIALDKVLEDLTTQKED